MNKAPSNGLLAMRGGEPSRRRRETRFMTDWQRHRLQSERGENIGVGRVARRRDGDPRARIESGGQRQQKAAGGTGRHNHPVRRDRNAVARMIMRSDTLAQRDVAQRLAIANAPVPERGFGGGAHQLWNRRAGFAQLHMHDAATGAFQLRRLTQHVHGQKRRDGGAAGWVRRVSHDGSTRTSSRRRF